MLALSRNSALNSKHDLSSTSAQQSSFCQPREAKGGKCLEGRERRGRDPLYDAAVFIV